MRTGLVESHPNAVGFCNLEVLSADAFSAFEDAGLNDSKAVKETGQRFRETILALGGGKAPLELLKFIPVHDLFFSLSHKKRMEN
ncbi:hypothetical protein CDL15_Pgr017226 [Punica granatum]|uniref:Uncharacterized protein n=1 Tax=Punica granatum TaxID=22663 RepID=A0A218WRV7_PUNGR|nr:hypothetical protein CDL15_Pgr017226 [Punica granatum]